jgi:hypothetical protein
MKLRSTSFLGISFSDRAVVCAEVAVANGRRLARRSAEFPIPAGMSVDKPEQLGPALAAFLREQQFAATRAVVGVPARWLIALERDVPPAGAEQANAVLRMQAERLAVSESGEMVFDYAGRPDAKQATKVLLVGMQRQRLDAVERTLAAAGVTAVSVTSSALALAGAAEAVDGDRPMLLLGRQGAEMVWRHEGSPRMLRHVSVVAANGHGVSVAPLGLELSRAVTLTRVNGSPTPGELMLWDSVGLSADQVGELSDRSGLAVRQADARVELKVESAGAQAAVADDSFAPALALALAGADRDALPVDFKRSRLTPQKARRVGRKSVWAGAVGALLAVGILALYLDVRAREAEVAAITQRLADNKDSIKAAENMVGRVNYTRGFFEARTPYLDCLADLTKAFPARDNELIWVTSLTLRESREPTPQQLQQQGPSARWPKGQAQGKADRNDTVLSVLQTLKRNPKFANVQILDLRDAGGRTREVSFSIGFSYVTPE